MLTRYQVYHCCLPVLLCVIFISAQLCGLSAPTAPLSEDTARFGVLRTFLTAMLRKDMTTCRNLLPTSDQQLFGPFPFHAPPTLSHPYVCGDQGMLDWHGQPLDPKLPTHGTLLFRLTTGPQGGWKVRQCCFYDEMPALVKAQGLYCTAADHQAEALLAPIGQRYLRAWAAGQYTAMHGDWFDWTQVDRRYELKIDITVSRMTTLAQTAHMATVFVGFMPKVPFYHKMYYGTVTLVLEKDGWKVRGSYLEFYTANHGPIPE